MDNYKIKVKDEAESKEAQELFFELGFQHRWDGAVLKESWSTARLVYAENGILWSGNCSDDFHECEFQELTLPQLRDLVVLKRNDVKDATHNNFRTNTPYLKQGENEYYMLNGEWVLSNCPNDLEPINQPQDPALISGADAKLTWAQGIDLQINKKDTHFGFIDMSNDYSLGVFDNENYEFRLKPRTITLNVEIPCCGTNYKQGQLIWILNSLEPTEYCSIILDESDELPSYWWSTEEEIKQVVEQLRKIRGTNS